MAITLLVISIIIVLERYANRTDTKAAEEKRKQLSNDLDPSKTAGSFFSNDEMFKRTSTARSMTVKLKTMKTTDLDLQGGAA
jgi:UDP-N-acetylenolpyruvoylglucosamine reductase